MRTLVPEPIRDGSPDLTPQSGHLWSRLEKVVGWFVTIATLLLLGGLAYYIYHPAERAGSHQSALLHLS
jgi:lipoprotein signal peptidase